jgi:hypothetical protein
VDFLRAHDALFNGQFIHASIETTGFGPRLRIADIGWARQMAGSSVQSLSYMSNDAIL